MEQRIKFGGGVLVSGGILTFDLSKIIDQDQKPGALIMKQPCITTAIYCRCKSQYPAKWAAWHSSALPVLF